jgi:hypothetical protein
MEILKAKLVGSVCNPRARGCIFIILDGRLCERRSSGLARNPIPFFSPVFFQLLQDFTQVSANVRQGCISPHELTSAVSSHQIGLWSPT